MPTIVGFLGFNPATVIIDAMIMKYIVEHIAESWPIYVSLSSLGLSLGAFLLHWQTARRYKAAENPILSFEKFRETITVTNNGETPANDCSASTRRGTKISWKDQYVQIKEYDPRIESTGTDWRWTEDIGANTRNLLFGGELKIVWKDEVDGDKLILTYTDLMGKRQVVKKPFSEISSRTSINASHRQL